MTYIISRVSQFLVLRSDLCDSPSVIVGEKNVSGKGNRNTRHSDSYSQEGGATHVGELRKRGDKSNRSRGLTELLTVPQCMDSGI